jgi:cytosine deaminase
VTDVRAQIDVDELVGLAAIQAALELRAECASWIDLQVVAFPQEGVLSRPPVVPLLREALGRGADAVGGGAGLDPGVSTEDHLSAVFALAREFDVDVDLHPDLASGPQTPPELWEVQEVARQTRAAGWEGRVVVSHLSGIGAMADEPARRLASLLYEHGISVVTVPGAEFHSAAAWRNPPVYDVRQAITSVPLLLEEGVNLSLATGHVRDPLNPHGTADPLRDLLMLTSGVALGEPIIAGVPALNLVTTAPRRALRLPPLAIEVGAPADLVVLEAEPDALPRTVERVRHVFKAGVRVWSA